MSGESNDNEKQFDAEDIRRYLSGEMPTAEMHALERASLEDPMLGDALEGMREIKPDTRADLEALRRRLRERTEEKMRPVPLWRSWARVAAAVILLMGLAGIGYFFSLTSGTAKDIALQNPVEAPKPDASDRTDSVQDKTAPPSGTSGQSAQAEAAKTAKAAQPAPAPAKTTEKIPPVPINPSTALPTPVAGAASAATSPKPKSLAPASAAPASGEAETRNSVTSNAVTPEPVAAGAVPTGSLKDASPARQSNRLAADANEDDASARADSSLLRESIPEKKNRADLAGELKRKKGGIQTTNTNAGSQPMTFTGQVLDDKGLGIPGVSIGTGKSHTVTDLNGKFVFAAPGNVNQVDFSSVGYLPQTLITDGLPATGLIIRLTPASVALAEVVVSGYGATQKRQTGPLTTNPGGPQPTPGWSSFHNYLGANKFRSTIDSSLHGTEMVTFTITRNGEPVDFSVDESVSAEHDSLVVRMIRNGPKWTPSKEPTHRVTLVLPY